MSGDPEAALAAIEKRAKAGDAVAQFELAVNLDRAGRRGEATTWLERSAERGNPDALTLLAVRDLQGFEKARDVPSALGRLRRAVDGAGTGAARLLAVLTAIGADRAPDWPAAIALVIAAARTGDPGALRELAFLCEMAAPGSAFAEDLLVRAGLNGDGFAAFAVLRRQAMQQRALAHEHYGAQWRAGMARLQHPLYDRIAAPVALTGEAREPTGGIDWDALTALLKTLPGVGAPTPTTLNERPTVVRFDKLLSHEECEYLVGLSARHLRPAEIVDQKSGEAKHSLLRTNSVAVLWPAHQDLVVHALNIRLATAAGLAVEQGEMINVLMYKPGEEYRAHFDFFPVDAAKADPSGQRIRTLLVFLNADYTGGETHFITAQRKVRGDVGDAILFHNCDASGAPDRTSLHAGMPVTSGAKWLLSKWWREKRFVA